MFQPMLVQLQILQFHVVAFFLIELVGGCVFAVTAGDHH